MKRSLLTLAGMSLLASPAAFASKARTQALGEGDYSRYIADQRDVLSNPANYVDYNNFVIFEWGNDDNAATNYEAEGGFARQSGNFVYGVYLGNDHAYYDGSIAANPDFQPITNTVDVSIAGDAGVKWGATLAYGKREDTGTNAQTTTGQSTAETDRLALRGGVIGANWDASLSWEIDNEATGSRSAGTVSNATDVDPRDTYEFGGFTLSASYSWMDWKFFGEYDSKDVDVKDGSQTTQATVNSETSTWVLGAGNTRKLSDKATMWWSLSYESSEEDYGVFGGTAKGSEEYSRLVLHVALEAQATSWLTLRGGVKQRALIDNTESKATTAGAPTLENNGAGTTTVSAGAGLTFDKLMVDGTFAATTGRFALGGSNSTSDDTSTLANVSVHYWF